MLLVMTVASQVEGDHLRQQKLPQYMNAEPSPVTPAPVKRPESLNDVRSDSIPSKETSHRRVITPNSPKSTTTGSTGERSCESSPPNLEYKTCKGISSNEFIELCQQLSDPNCPFSYLQ